MWCEDTGLTVALKPGFYDCECGSGKESKKEEVKMERVGRATRLRRGYGVPSIENRTEGSKKGET